MATLHRQARLGWIALVAIVGVLSSAEGASAGTIGGGADHAGGCCISRPMDDCGCCTAPAPTPAATGGEPATVAEHHAPAGPASLRRSARPCECRAGDPAAPASKNERPSPERRQGDQRSLAGAVCRLTAEHPSPFAACRLLPGSSPPRSPLYLRTLRLLI